MKIKDDITKTNNAFRKIQNQEVYRILKGAAQRTC